MNLKQEFALIENVQETFFTNAESEGCFTKEGINQYCTASYCAFILCIHFETIDD